MTEEPTDGQTETTETPSRPEENSDTHDLDWLGSVLRPALVVVLVLCIDAGMLVFVRQLAPEIVGTLLWTLLVLGAITGIVAVTTTTWLAHPNQRLRRSIGYRAAELVLLVLAARAAIWLGQGQFPSLDAMLNHADETFLDGAFILTGFALVITWYAAIDFTGDLNELALQPDEIVMSRRRDRGIHDTTRPARSNRRTTLQRFVGRWVGWGMFLIVLAAALRMGVVREHFWSLVRMEIDPLIIGVIIVYFIAGLVLISQGQFALLRARWTIDRVPNSNSILRNWPIYTAALVLAFALLALMLPLGDTFLISTVLTFLVEGIYVIVSLVFQFISLLVLLVLSLLPISDVPLPPPAPQPARADTQPPLPMLEIPPWVGGVAFWAVILLILAFAAYFYLTDKEASLRWLRQFLTTLIGRWRQLFDGWRDWRAVQLVSRRGPGHQIQGNQKQRRWPWQHSRGNLTPDQSVRLLYFQLLDYADQHEVPRKPSETPNDYALRLPDAFKPDIDHDEQVRQPVEGLTAAFNAVRYGPGGTTEEQATRLADLWNHLRQHFQSKSGPKSPV